MLSIRPTRRFIIFRIIIQMTEPSKVIHVRNVGHEISEATSLQCRMPQTGSGFAPNIQENKEGLELLKTAIAKAGYTRKHKLSYFKIKNMLIVSAKKEINSKLHVVIGMDVAATMFYEDKSKTYDLNIKEENNDGSEKISGDNLKNVYKSFVGDYPIVSIEDPFDQDDWVVYADGSICLDILQNQWSPIYDVAAILTSI
ncbi:unnamed protein product [Lactuca virosa]|uniref:phosphopyruvate hydratase n=1 Tax=Lactuca virosa TaxID=75947 RepID=A0AAU9NFB6_9ASTR|nr:unnamed protein product [Lactuca virosa]